MNKLTHIELSGYKSIEQMSLDLGPLNVLIGANGAGKSNLVSFFRLLHEISAARLQAFVGTSGGADSLLFYGAQTTRNLAATLTFETQVKYAMDLQYAAADTLVFVAESFPLQRGEQRAVEYHRAVGGGSFETQLHRSAEQGNPGAANMFELLGSLCVFQFHDTSTTSGMRRSVYIHDNRHLRHDAGNLAAVLYKLQQTQPAAYRRIVATIRQIAPWFGDFVLKPLELNKENVRLDWKELDPDVLFGPHQLSDGSLRAMALITLLLQPRHDLPSVIVIDEPELGLHPHAMVVVASLIKAAACHCQIIIATQSTSLLDQFEAEDVIVVDRDDRKSTFRRLEEEKLKEWLEEYSLSELWEKNVIGGGPA
jgi:predicted ATPase